MGRMSELDIERQEREAAAELALDFDERDAPAEEHWWSHQDAALEAEEMAQLESDAEIQEYRLQGYM